ncbi:glutamyl-tRNA reductase [Meiothermus hypogaeus]|uniref:Glutamyl-tRNA reductase n=2 Tax=Meiothermus hypogaeus TaxID=884155 RepID=A0A511QZU4_9DEIN|nr:glutamyl-tRNA reductase [Meiothermus hypogaeus]RIH77075.1 Glutamyl-tRNA reductase [Meiothermus hypogaeus]GEM82890.1 glutamyl-tRNA reductase [Meiothermus hypogaeus NBRC 106114]GIW37054.1 MAG: glutamyl-tRNA reductase [Meiothermus sp.]
MQRLALIGVSQRRGGVEALTQWSHWWQSQAPGVFELAEEWVLVLTCNRCEAVLALKEGVSLEFARQALIPPELPRGYAYLGEAALEHLARVAASLDSVNPGEDQIMRQVRQAFETAQQAGTVGPLTRFAFQSALKIAKRVRREVALAPAQTSLFSLARPALEALLPRPAKVAVVGTGEMGSLAARSLASLPGIELWLVNRTPEKARLLAEALGARFMSLQDFQAHPPLLDALVAATPVAGLLDAGFFQGQPRLKAAVDLGMPRNIVPEAARGVVLFDLNLLERLGEERRTRLRADLARAEMIVAEELEQAVADWLERAIAPAITQMREAYRRTLAEWVGAQVAPELIEQLAHRFAHFPVKGLRGLARRHGPEAAEHFLQEAGLLEVGRG